MESSSSLVSRFGRTIPSPTTTDIVQVVDEVHSEGRLRLSEGELSEHPNAWLEYGYQDGEYWTVYSLDYYRSGRLILAKRADQDDDFPEFEYELQKLPADEVTVLMGQLSEGKAEAVLARFTRV